MKMLCKSDLFEDIVNEINAYLKPSGMLVTGLIKIVDSPKGERLEYAEESDRESDFFDHEYLEEVMDRGINRYEYNSHGNIYFPLNSGKYVAVPFEI